MPVEKLTPSFTFTEERLQALQAVVPEAFADGQVNWETLKAALEPFLEDEGPGTEHFGLFWPGKRQARRLAAQPSKGTLRPVPGQGINEDTTRNLFIEGDNLEVLKLLQKSYAGRVKLIYIDPPYNTGNDFVYKDDFREPLEDYLKRTGQADAEGLLTTNPKAGGRFHSNWLNMMLPRLMLARTLLSEDGVIFISIDDNELANLRLLMDEIFGGENFVVIFPWKKRTAKSDVPFGVSQDFEWIISYTKGSLNAGLDYQRKYYQTDDYPNDRWRLSDLTTQRTSSERLNSAFNMIDPKTGKEYPFNKKRVWGVTKDTFDEYYKKGKIVFPDDYDFLNIKIPAYRVFESEDKEKAMKKFGSEDAKKAASTVFPKEIGMSEDGNREVADLFGEKIFSFPKPTTLIKHILSIINKKEGIILDFFSGSSTTANAVLELNREDGGNRQFIMVQMPEPTPPDAAARQAGYKTIADIGKERIRRVIAKLAKQPVLDRDPPEDLGFAVYRLDRSHFKAWQDYDGPPNPAAIDDLFSRFEDPLTPGWQPRALLDEVLLLQGFPLDSRRTRLKDYSSNVLVRIECDWFSYRLFVCLDSALHPATLDQLPLDPDDKFICLDSALIDQTKQQLTDRCTLVVI